MSSSTDMLDFLLDENKCIYDVRDLYDLLRLKGLFKLTEKLQQAIAEREQLQQQNYTLQHKLAEYFRKKKADESRQEYDKNVTDQEQRYLKYMGERIFHFDLDSFEKNVLHSIRIKEMVRLLLVLITRKSNN